MTMRFLVRTDVLAGDRVAGELEATGLRAELQPVPMSPFYVGIGCVETAVPEEERQRALSVLDSLRRLYPRMPLDFGTGPDWTLWLAYGMIGSL